MIVTNLPSTPEATWVLDKISRCDRYVKVCCSDTILSNKKRKVR